ncbi:MarR family winged helix-turn-helix transcriptional regulator [Cellulomonas marina]|uniref:DNA-binding transcriptional regulator, MarR family n=1 Tax=Cellulomonas marina TaxID=988821 RepID=A0A1I0ZA47_9CELL|nr:MarR family winged helix-turn-helix transcriptional regulator [Cellulomonas marina]GIG29025.1 MarR family transcriptional regulator [Cellulomonas marina]SFB21996.1 DNA-binding transcriptional regulator, MarR family [Cellulomonas marina]
MHDVAPQSPYAFLSEEETRAWYAYMKVHLRLRYEMNRQLGADHGLSLADYDVLVALVSQDPEPMTVSDVAVRIGAERSRVSHQVRRMAGRGLVALAGSPDDRRATTVALTEEGRASLAAATPGHVALVRSVFLDALSGDQLQELAVAMEGVYESLIERGTLPRPRDHP